jgi:hypothetical protein
LNRLSLYPFEIENNPSNPLYLSNHPLASTYHSLSAKNALTSIKLSNEASNSSIESYHSTLRKSDLLNTFSFSPIDQLPDNPINLSLSISTKQSSPRSPSMIISSFALPLNMADPVNSEKLLSILSLSLLVFRSSLLFRSLYSSLLSSSWSTSSSTSFHSLSNYPFFDIDIQAHPVSSFTFTFKPSPILMKTHNLSNSPILSLSLQFLDENFKFCPDLHIVTNSCSLPPNDLNEALTLCLASQSLIIFASYLNGRLSHQFK